ncbi:MAG: L-lactate permease [Planctomycetaceae bacterium]
MPWTHVYDPLGWAPASTAMALVPLAVLLGLLAGAGWAAWKAAVAGLAAALVIAVAVVGMPADAAAAAALHGAAFGLFPIGWIVVAAMFLYRLSVEAGAIEVMKRSVTGLSADHRLQALLIAFSFGAFLEGAAGFGAPVAISAALLAGAGFPALEAACVALVANTAPVAFGALGTPIVTLAKVTGLDENAISALAGRQLPFFSLIVPAWMVCMMAGWRGLVGVWPAVLVSGLSFAVVQAALANLVGPALVDVVGGVASLAALAVFLRAWRPAQCWRHGAAPPVVDGMHDPARRVAWAWAPWAFLSLAVFAWGVAPVKALLEGRGTPAATILAPEFPVPRLDGRVAKVPPATREAFEVERAVYRFNWLSAAGTGSLQRVTAEQLGFDPLLTCTANSTGGVMGKMIDAQSIVVAATATGEHRREGAILRRAFPHSLALAALVGLLVWLQTGPLAWMVPPGP